MIQKIKNKITYKTREIKYLKKKSIVFGKMGLSKKSYAQFKHELLESGLIAYIIKETKQYEEKHEGREVRGRQFCFGGLGKQESIDLYCLIRSAKPKVIIETGVCNGVSSAIILKALQKNGSGKLISIDYPEIEGIAYTEDAFWVGKGGTVIPKEKTPGWIIPEDLKDNWTLLLGRSQDILPGLMEQTKEVDIFIHDSEHSYECMTFEYECAFPYIAKGGLMMSDDIFANDAFDDFAEKENYEKDYLSYSLGVLIKK